jgi:hypothetical protein
MWHPSHRAAKRFFPAPALPAMALSAAGARSVDEGDDGIEHCTGNRKGRHAGVRYASADHVAQAPGAVAAAIHELGPRSPPAPSDPWQGAQRAANSFRPSSIPCPWSAAANRRHKHSGRT